MTPAKDRQAVRDAALTRLGRKRHTLVIPVMLQSEMAEIAAAVCAIAAGQTPALSAEATQIIEEVLQRSMDPSEDPQ